MAYRWSAYLGGIQLYRFFSLDLWAACEASGCLGGHCKMCFALHFLVGILSSRIRFSPSSTPSSTQVSGSTSPKHMAFEPIPCVSRTFNLRSSSRALLPTQTKFRFSMLQSLFHGAPPALLDLPSDPKCTLGSPPGTASGPPSGCSNEPVDKLLEARPQTFQHLQHSLPRQIPQLHDLHKHPSYKLLPYASNEVTRIRLYRLRSYIQRILACVYKPQPIYEIVPRSERQYLLPQHLFHTRPHPFALFQECVRSRRLDKVVEAQVCGAIVIDDCSSEEVLSVVDWERPGD